MLATQDRLFKKRFCWGEMPHGHRLLVPSSMFSHCLIQARRTKSFTTAWKSMFKLVKLPSLVVKCCKMRKIWHREVCEFAYKCITHAKAYHFCINFAWLISMISFANRINQSGKTDLCRIFIYIILKWTNRERVPNKKGREIFSANIWC